MAYAVPNVTRLLGERLIAAREAQAKVEESIERLTTFRDQGTITQQQLDDALREAYEVAETVAEDEQLDTIPDPEEG